MASNVLSETTTDSQSQLLELAAELRNEIYRLVLISVQEIPIHKVKETALLSVSRQVRQEILSILSIFWAENTFYEKGFEGQGVSRKEHANELAVYLNDIGPPKVQFITSFKVYYHPGHSFYRAILGIVGAARRYYEARVPAGELMPQAAPIFVRMQAESLSRCGLSKDAVALVPMPHDGFFLTERERSAWARCLNEELQKL